MDHNLRIGVPSKGRLSEAAAELLGEAGLRFRRQDRSLFARCRELPLDVVFLRTDDIPVLCAEGAIDLGITGSDLVAESGASVKERLALGIGACRLALCVPESSPIAKPEDLVAPRVATSFPRVTQKFLADAGVSPHLVELTGSVEAMVSLGVADAIVDLIETGSTLAANQLRIVAEIGSYQTVLIQNEAARGAELADRITRRLENVVIARSYSLLEYNISRERLADAEAIAPGFHSPTISELEDPNWCAVRVMVRRGEVWEIMERLESL
ncbi:MAG: ATP phosphoribosyltransferase, partial [Planctomycetales bacterium]|nr:ATP phosphoribosyltransferase [Planctomycetales bacterium]